jgi:membrane protein implicated in regulation of membrane protease activity
VACYGVRKKTTATSNPGTNRDVNLDIGETVLVDSWSADGTTSVKYRGAQWSAVRAAGTLPSTGTHRIVEVRGSQLILEKYQP